jgi:hypothetical protein
MVPDTYYGFTSTVENLSAGSKLYVGPHNRVEEMILQEIRYDSNLNSYEIHTDKAILLAAPLTRVAYSTVSK